MADPGLIGLAGNPALPADLLARLVAVATELGDVKLRWELGDRPDLTEAQREAVAVRYDVAESARVRPAEEVEIEGLAEYAIEAPAEVATKLARHPNADIRRAVAFNLALPLSALLELLAADDPPVHDVAAGRTDLPARIYADLAQDERIWVRSELAQNPAIGEDVMRKLATDNGYSIQRNLALNPNLPLDVLVRLADVTKIGSTLLPRIAAATPSEVEELAASEKPIVRMLVAQRRDLPPRVRDALAADLDAKVLKSIAPHPGLSDSQLRTMVARYGTHVLAKVAANPDATPALLAELARHQPSTQKALRVLAARTDLPADVIVELLGHDNAFVVEAAAANPSLPRDAMARLLP